MKHSTEVQPAQAVGLLLGLDLDGILEVSNCFPLPHAPEEDDKSNKALMYYQAAMLRSIADVQGDDSVVGFYQSTTLGAFFSQNLVELQVTHQERLRRGGLVVIHGASATHHDDYMVIKRRKQMFRMLREGRLISVPSDYERTSSLLIKRAASPVKSRFFYSSTFISN